MLKYNTSEQKPNGYRLVKQGSNYVLEYLTSFHGDHSRHVATLIGRKNNGLETICQLFKIPPNVVEAFLGKKYIYRNFITKAFHIFVERYRPHIVTNGNMKTIQEYHYLGLQAIELILEGKNYTAITLELQMCGQTLRTHVLDAKKILENGWEDFQQDILTAIENEESERSGLEYNPDFQ